MYRPLMWLFEKKISRSEGEGDDDGRLRIYCSRFPSLAFDAACLCTHIAIHGLARASGS